MTYVIGGHLHDRSAVLATKIRTAFAPRSLATWPAPLEAHPALARALGLPALWLKREDLTGGNKVRGLEFLLAGAPPRSVFVTIGATGSSHCLATARSAKIHGYRTAVATFPQPETDASSRRRGGHRRNRESGRPRIVHGHVAVGSAAPRGARRIISDGGRRTDSRGRRRTQER